MPGRLSIATWLMVVGLVLGVIGAGSGAWLAASGRLTITPLEMTPPAIAVGALLLLGGFAFLIGLALYVVLPSLDRYKAREAYGAHRTVLACLALAYAMALVLQGIFRLATWGLGMSPAAASNGGPPSVTPVEIFVGIVTLELSLLLILWIRVIRPGIITWKRMGVTGEHLGRRMAYGLAASVAVIIAAAILESIFAQLGLHEAQTRLFSSIKQASTLEFMAVLAAAGPLAGFVEEAFFRGYVFQAYWEQKGTWRAYIYSSLIFGIVHVFTFNFLTFLPTFTVIVVIGLLLAFVYRRSQSIIPTVVGHGINNTVAFAALYFGPG